MATTSSIELSEILRATELKLLEYCRSKSIEPSELKNNMDKFSGSELDGICDLLITKLSCQRSLFESKGGQLENIRFIARYR